VRDIALTLLVAGLLPLSLTRPVIGALLFAWVSIMNPHKLAYGFANSFPFAMVIAAVTLLGFLVSHKARKPLPMSGAMASYILLMLWMTLTSTTSLGEPAWVRDRWIFVMKIHIMVLVTMMLVRGRQHIEALMWVVVGSVTFYGVKGGIFTVVTGGGRRVWGPPGGMIEDNNALAVALVMVMPLLYYLMSTQARRWGRIALGVCMLLMGFAILGSQSRGALLALLAMAVMLGLKSKYPFRLSLLIGVVVMVAITFMPDTWSTRMDTIQNYKADSSAMSRLYTWATLWNLTLDRPILGAGFGTDTLNVFRRYAPTQPPFDVFTGSVWVAHSIYFQAMSEHGFVGLLFYSLLFYLSWRIASRVAKRSRQDPAFADWAPLLMRMCQVSLIGYAAGGAFLSLMHLDVIYYLLAIILVTDATLRESQKAPAAGALPGTAAPAAVIRPPALAAGAASPKVAPKPDTRWLPKS
jgi:probable O-glycosylation ligase (exosortase A-associated)